MKTLNKLIVYTLITIFCFSLFSCKNNSEEQNQNPLPEVLPTGEVQQTPVCPNNKTPETSVTEEVVVTPTEENKETEEVEQPKNTIVIYLDLDWENVTEAYFNDTAMVAGTYDNGCEFMVEIEADSITKFDLDFHQNNAWWHVQDEYQSWNTDSSIETDMKKGETYIVKDVNWSYQYDNEEQKWYTCTIEKQ